MNLIQITIGCCLGLFIVCSCFAALAFGFAELARRQALLSEAKKDCDE